MHTAGTATVGAASLGLVASISLIVLLIAKELSAAADQPVLAVLGQYVDVAIMPLLIVFVAILAMNIVSVL